MEPQPVGHGFAELLGMYPPGHRLNDLAKEVIKAGHRCANRRAAVLKYADLARRLTQPPLNYERASQWNGWIPPAIINPGSDEELLRSTTGAINQRGKRARGEYVNDSPLRAELVEIATEAWAREHPDMLI